MNPRTAGTPAGAPGADNGLGAGGYVSHSDAPDLMSWQPHRPRDVRRLRRPAGGFCCLIPSYFTRTFMASLCLHFASLRDPTMSHTEHCVLLREALATPYDTDVSTNDVRKCNCSSSGAYSLRRGYISHPRVTTQKPVDRPTSHRQCFGICTARLRD